jgi:hypothetical protein
MIKWIYARLEKWGPSSKHMITSLAFYGRLETLKWVHEHGCPINDNRACEFAAMEGQLETLQWLRQISCPWNAEVCRIAASFGHLAILQWARTTVPPCPWDFRVCNYAAREGHLEILQWAVANDCQWKPKSCMAFTKNSEIIGWIAATAGIKIPTKRKEKCRGYDHFHLWDDDGEDLSDDDGEDFSDDDGEDFSDDDRE